MLRVKNQIQQQINANKPTDNYHVRLSDIDKSINKLYKNKDDGEKV